jgi:hypothetical protein
MSAATRFIEWAVDHYGVESALSRARMMTHERSYRHQPKWLTEAIAILERMAQQESEK